MSVAPYQPGKTRPKPPSWGWGPDGRYTPLTDDGELPRHLPGHLELPEENGEIVENFREQPQGEILDQGIRPILERIHPDSRYVLGHDCGIYWRLTNPRASGAVCPDWFYVPGVPPVLQDGYRRSYVLWKENIRPTVLIEYASDHGEKERNPTPGTGKFWVYEKAVRGEYYAIFIVATGELEVYRRRNGKYRPLRRNAHNHHPIKPLGVALGVWHGLYGNETAPWLRWYDNEGKLLPIDV
jgi:Uma2 family endonuclease